MFAGYGFLHQAVNAYGCTQTASNPSICAGGIPDSTAVITQSNYWNALRLGVNGELEFGKGWRLKGEAAALPFVKLDRHRLSLAAHRPTGTSPAAFRKTAPAGAISSRPSLDYTLANRVTVGVGGRYWHMQSKRHHPLREPHRRRRRLAAAGRLGDRLLRRDRPRRLAVLSGVHSEKALRVDVDLDAHDARGRGAASSHLRI